MKFHNEGIEFSKLDNSVRESFGGGVARKVLFPPGTRLVRVVTLGNNSFLGAFCISEQDYNRIRTCATLYKIKIEQALREALAISTDFSPTINLAVVVTLG